MIYLDNAATTPLSMEMQLYLTSMLNDYGNPSSIYDIGQKNRFLVEHVRQSVADFINADPKEIVFTSGGSASNTLAIRGFTEGLKDFPILYSPICHKSISKMMESDEFSIYRIEKLEVNSNGEILIDDLKSKLHKFKKLTHYAPLVVIGLADSEIGTIQDVARITKIVHKNGGYVYLDATGGIASMPCNVRELDVDMMGFSAHKLGALKGCGVLYFKKNIELIPLVYGSQEQGLFGGTENVLGIASLGFAIDHWDYSHTRDKIRVTRDFYDKLKQQIPDTELIGVSLEDRNPGNLFISFKGVAGEALLTLLGMDKIYVSTGSACNSSSLEISSTLKAIGMSEEKARTCIRFSFSGQETEDELDEVVVSITRKIRLLEGVF